MKYGMRKPSIKKSVKARTTGRIKREVKKAVIPTYGKKGYGAIKNPKKSVYNKVYNRTSFSAFDGISTSNKANDSKTYSTNQSQQDNTGCGKGCLILIGIIVWIVLLFAAPMIWFFLTLVLSIIFFAISIKMIRKQREAKKAAKIDSDFTENQESTSAEVEEIIPAVEEQQIEDIEATEPIPDVVEVVGTYYTNAKQILRNVVKDNGGLWNVSDYQFHELELTLVPEPENPYDPNAILVVSEYPTPTRAKISRSGNIGHLPKEIAKKISLTEPVKVDAGIREGFGEFDVSVDISKIK